MNDKDFLWWLADRLVYVYHENKDIDFIHKLVSIAEATPVNRLTPNTKSYYDRRYPSTPYYIELKEAIDDLA
jgi:hypothetical protein